MLAGLQYLTNFYFASYFFHSIFISNRFMEQLRKRSYLKSQVTFLIILPPLWMADFTYACKQQRPEDIGSRIVDIYPNWVKVSMFTYLYALATNFRLLLSIFLHTSPDITTFSKFHSKTFAYLCLIKIFFLKKINFLLQSICISLRIF